MDLLESLEIYIPVEAEVKMIPLWSLPNSVLRRMGLPLADTEGSRRLAESPEGIWICPAVLRRKGQKLASPAGNSMIENITSLMGKDFRAAQGPFRMSFVSSNHAAYKVLKDTLPGKKVSTHTPHMSLSPPGSALQTYQYAVVIYHGRIYLSIRRPSRSQSQRETEEPQPASQSPIPSTSDVSSKSQKRQPPQASREPADKKLQRKRLRITLPKIASKQPRDLLIKPDHSTTDQELLNDKSPKKHTTCKITHSDNRKDVMQKGRDVSSSKLILLCSDSVHNTDSQCPRDAGGEQAAEEAAGPEPALFRPQEEQEEVANNDAKESESTVQNNDMYSGLKIDSGEPDSIVGIEEQSSNPSWSRRESQGAACASTSLQQDCDFKELAQEEKIAQMKAKLRLSEAALNSLHSS